jgi:predicted PurR-regulated permease PerM
MVKRPELAAGILTLFWIFVIVIPLGAVAPAFGPRADALVHRIRELAENGLPPAPDFLSRIPLIGDTLTAQWNALSAGSQVVETIRPYFARLGDFALTVGGHMAQTALLLLLSLVFAFFLYASGRSLAGRLRAMALRVGGEQGGNLLRVAEATMRSVVYAIVATAVAQAALAWLGLWISGVPGAGFLALLVGLISLIPLGLGGLILYPAAAWLAYSGSTGWGIFLALWTFFVVMNADNLLRPLIISRGANLPISIVLIGVIGGLMTIGILGIFIGATLTGVVYTMLELWSSTPARADAPRLPEQPPAAAEGSSPPPDSPPN